MYSSSFCFSVKLVKACLSTPALPSIHGVSYDIIIKINSKNVFFLFNINYIWRGHCSSGKKENSNKSATARTTNNCILTSTKSFICHTKDEIKLYHRYSKQLEKRGSKIFLLFLSKRQKVPLILGDWRGLQHDCSSPSPNPETESTEIPIYFPSSCITWELEAWYTLWSLLVFFQAGGRRD